MYRIFDFFIIFYIMLLVDFMYRIVIKIIVLNEKIFRNDLYDFEGICI